MSKKSLGTRDTDESPLTRASRDASKLALEVMHGLASDLIKQQLFGPSPTT